MYTFLIADDHPLFREAIQQVIRSHFTSARLLESPDLDGALALAAQEEDIDLVLLDLNMPGMQGLEGLKTLLASHPALPVVMVSAEDNRQVVLQAISAGAVGFIAKTAARQEVLAALEQLLRGEVYLPAQILRQPRTQSEPEAPTLPNDKVQGLTRKQRQVLERMALGESNKQIAWHLNLAETTIKGHVSAILAQLEMSNRVQVALAARNWLQQGNP